MISGIENIRTMFGILHDGDLRFCKEEAGALSFHVEIRYLTERIDPAYKSLLLRLDQPRRLVFKPWWPEGHPLYGTLIEGVSLFRHELEILYARAEGGGLSVSCNANTDADFSGGDLYLEADAAVVLDESGRDYSLDELRSLCEGYWQDRKREGSHSKVKTARVNTDDPNK